MANDPALEEAAEGFIVPSMITEARPLLLVHRDSPREAYLASEQHWIDEEATDER